MRRVPSATRVASASLALLLATAAAVLAAASPAAAHGTLAMSVPADGAAVPEPLPAVELYFTEKVAPNAYFTITAPGGGRVDNGWTHGAPKPLAEPVREYFMVEGKFEPREYTTGFPAVVAIAHLPAAGRYSVSYLSVASDGEAVRGTMSFTYSGEATAAPQGWSAPTDQPDPALVAAVEGHGADPVATPPASSAPPVVAPASAADEGAGGGWVAWSGWLVAAAAAVAGIVGWRRKAAPARRRGGDKAARGTGRGTGKPAATRAGGGKGTRAAATPPPEVDSTAGGPTNTRLALLAGGLVVALLGGFGLGRLGGGEGSGAAAAPVPTAGAAMAADGHQHPAGTGPHSHAGTALATGMSVSDGGYTLEPVTRSQAAGAAGEYAFRIVGTDRRPATRFVVVHDRPLHLIVVGRDLSGYQHLHPAMDPDGTWRVPLTLDRPGAYRVYADFAVIGADGAEAPLVLGVDHLVPGAHTPAVLPAPAGQVSAGPFAVSMRGTPTVGVSAPILLQVSRTGTPGPVALERYLGAYGHLVVVREGDLGYVHVHPEAELVDGAVKFWLTAPGTGRYRAFFDFQVAGQVHTAEYTIDIP